MIPEIISGIETLTELEELGEEYTISLKKDTDENQKQTAIKLMTVHASKGLEFDTVIIPGCNEGSFPHGKILSEESVEEERRIFYVAMTRARENLLLFYISSKDNSKYIPSRFLNPLLK
jgi:DNA helicase-2/ATP-dependent DNA helicase PcrA